MYVTVYYFVCMCYNTHQKVIDLYQLLLISRCFALIYYYWFSTAVTTYVTTKMCAYSLVAVILSPSQNLIHSGNLFDADAAIGQTRIITTAFTKHHPPKTTPLPPKSVGEFHPNGNSGFTPVPFSTTIHRSVTNTTTNECSKYTA